MNAVRAKSAAVAVAVAGAAAYLMQSKSKSEVDVVLTKAGTHRLVIRGPDDVRFRADDRPEPREDPLLLGRVRAAVRDKTISELDVSSVRLSDSEVRFLFGAFKELSIVHAKYVYSDDENWAVTATDQMRERPLRRFGIIECNLGILGLRSMMEFFESHPDIQGIVLSNQHIPNLPKEDILRVQRYLDRLPNAGSFSFYLPERVKVPGRPYI